MDGGIPATSPSVQAGVVGGGSSSGGNAGGAVTETFGHLQRFAFAPHLPPDCQLRVRELRRGPGSLSI